MTMAFISLFCLFISTTYSYFHFLKHLDSTIITVAKLKYELTSTNNNFTNNSITVEPGETLELQLDLKSLNSENTKYALNYSGDELVKVFSYEKLEQNVKGIIGGLNSIINIHLIIENKSNREQTVQFTLKGGYLQNDIESGSQNGYWKGDIWGARCTAKISCSE